MGWKYEYHSLNRLSTECWLVHKNHQLLPGLLWAAKYGVMCSCNKDALIGYSFQSIRAWGRLSAWYSPMEGVCLLRVWNKYIITVSHPINNKILSVLSHLVNFFRYYMNSLHLQWRYQSLEKMPMQSNLIPDHMSTTRLIDSESLTSTFLKVCLIADWNGGISISISAASQTKM